RNRCRLGGGKRDTLADRDDQDRDQEPTAAAVTRWGTPAALAFAPNRMCLVGRFVPFVLAIHRAAGRPGIHIPLAVGCDRGMEHHGTGPLTVRVPPRLVALSGATGAVRLQPGPGRRPRHDRSRDNA